ncbi:MAG: MFS transporter [Tuberibacillus sp.]
MFRINNFIKAYHPIVHLLMIGTVLINLSTSMSVVYLPIYLMNTAELDPFMVGMIVGAGALAGTIGGFVGGTLSDLFGRNRLILISLLVLGTVFIGFLVTQESILLLALNIFRGLFSAFFLTVSKALMGDLTPKEMRFRAFSNRYLAGNIGFSVGPIIGTLFGIAGNKGAFLFTAVIYVGYFLLLFILFRVYKISIEVSEAADKTPIKQALFIFGKDKALLLFVIGSVFLTTVHGEMSVTLSQYLKMDVEKGVELFGYLMSLNGFIVIFTQVFITRWSERFGLFTRIAMGCLFFSLGEIGFAFSTHHIFFILSMIVFTVGEILIIPSEFAQIDEITPNGMRGMYYGAQGFSEFGNFIGPWFGGLLLMYFGGQTMFLTFAGISLLSMVFYGWGRRVYARQSMSAEDKTA